ncbi:GNAT family N-acetyltransferase [Vibrio apostichopi]|uniref:GNAT family N-acetyltransferase n=1 Tax=Vibrio apostichopi TaxID=3035453 RepID=UPI002573563E|nr:GNAT family N-acetyltransferase [Vibrio sp. FE10]
MQQNIITERLILRSFKLSDSQRVAELAGDKVFADMTANIPHPYQPNMAVEWINTHEFFFNEGKGVIYAITLKGNDEIIGAVSFPSLVGGVGILGYWLGVPFWGQGIAYEASSALVEYSKAHLGLTELEVMHLSENKRSESVIRKLGVEFIEKQVRKIHGRERELCVYRSLL